MPFKFHLKKKSKQYNVVSKSLFVISVELLDNNTMECTLTSESTGCDCLRNVGQRLGLQQTEFFGLRYVSRRGYTKYRWVDMDRPLKRQLDKHSQEPTRLALGVLFYVSDVNLLKDEVTRYHYFLQLKADVIEGRIQCNVEQAISLAGYSLQAEFGDYDPERHTSDYLREFALIPRDLVAAFQTDEVLEEAVVEPLVQHYATLIGFPPPLAEMYYILSAQQLEGYGLHDCFIAKDESGNEVLMSASTAGIVMRRQAITGMQQQTYLQCYRWCDVQNLGYHKKTITVELRPRQTSPSSRHHRPIIVPFHFEDPDTAKYTWKMALLQLNFYKENQRGLENAMHALSLSEGNVSADSRQRAASASGETPSSRNSSGRSRRSHCTVNNSTGALHQPGFSQSEAEREDSPAYANQMAFSLHHARSTPSAGVMGSSWYSLESLPSGQNQNLPYGSGSVPVNNSSHMHSYVASHSHHDLQCAGATGTMPNNQPVDVEQLRALLPVYRPAPDYETAVRMKYGTGANAVAQQQQPQQHQPQSGNLFGMMATSTATTYVSSQPEIAHALTPADKIPTSTYQQHEHTENRQLQTEEYPLHMLQSLHYSTPELSTLSQPAQDENIKEHTPVSQPLSQHELDMLRLYKPPPPYPSGTQNTPTANGVPVSAVRNMSNSTPDLAHSWMASQVGGSSPDLVTMNPNPHSNLHHHLSQPEYPESYSAYANVESSDVKSTAAVTQQLKHQQKILALLQQEETQLAKAASQLGQCQNLQLRLIEGQVFAEFHQLAKRKEVASFATANKPENAFRNRYPDALPYEENRVRLPLTRENPTGYINASHISVKVGNETLRYIAGESPSAATVANFWQMVWESNVGVVVLLSPLTVESNLEDDEGAPSPIIRYWPHELQGPTLVYGELQVCCSFVPASGSCATVKLHLQHTLTRKSRTVWHFHYHTRWDDNGNPTDVHHFIRFLEEVSSVRRHVDNESLYRRMGLSPVLVHCGAGLGRTGVMLLADVMLHCVDHNQELDIPSVLVELRNQRQMLVQTASQYKFVYRVVIEYIKCSRLI